MKELLETITKSIVEKPDEVEISQEKQGEMEIYKIKANSEDLKYLIGKSGRTINAIRTLARIKAAKLSKRINIVISED